MVKVQYGTGYWVLAVILTLFTCGFGLLILLYMRTLWLDTATETGVTTLTGKSYQWSELSKVERTALTAGGGRVAGVGAMIFGKKRVIINTAIVSNVDEVVQFLESKVGNKVIG